MPRSASNRNNANVNVVLPEPLEGAASKNAGSDGVGIGGKWCLLEWKIVGMFMHPFRHKIVKEQNQQESLLLRQNKKSVFGV